MRASRRICGNGRAPNWAAPHQSTRQRRTKQQTQRACCGLTGHTRELLTYKHAATSAPCHGPRSTPRQDCGTTRTQKKGDAEQARVGASETERVATSYVPQPQTLTARCSCASARTPRLGAPTRTRKQVASVAPDSQLLCVEQLLLFRGVIFTSSATHNVRQMHACAEQAQADTNTLPCNLNFTSSCCRQASAG